MKRVHTIRDPKKSFEEIDDLIRIVFNGFMAFALDYDYHIKNTFAQKGEAKYAIYELRNNINYRLNSAKHHFYLMLKTKIEIENRFAKMLKDDPKIFDGFVMGNPYFDSAADEIMGIYDSVIFHLSSSFDYLAMLLQFGFGENPQSNLQWISLAKHCYSDTSSFSKRKFSENVKKVDRDFVSKFNDYRAELIHRKKSTAYTHVSWKLMSNEVEITFRASERLKTSLKKVIEKNEDYCTTFVTYKLLKETIVNIGVVLEGVKREFKENYDPYNPIYDGGFRVAVVNPDTKTTESPSSMYWEKFMEYKKLV